MTEGWGWAGQDLQRNKERGAGSKESDDKKVDLTRLCKACFTWENKRQARKDGNQRTLKVQSKER